MGFTVNFVSYSLLTDFITDFFRNGVTMRGFYASYESKCIMKYGMKEYELISWRAWHSGCNEFMNKIFDINQREAFSCISCPEQEFYASETSKDPGMNQFWRLLRTIDKTEKPSNGYLLLMKELSSYTSTLAIMQVVKKDLAGQLVKFLKDGQAFWRGTTNIDKHMLLQYPILMDIILALCDEQGVIALPVR